ncbi:MAG TPA: hypothetical protein VMT29_00470 [Steroidobacteraceae bacterium]|nr:hypothetical protein [Steroidobacteraceae bacterium]
MSSDLRGWRVALVPENLINPTQSATKTVHACLRALEASDYGVLQLPPTPEHGLLLAVIADQVAEYAHHGYAVVAVGLRSASGDGLHWRRVAPLLRYRGTTPPPRHVIRPDADASLEAERLSSFLTSYDLPEEEQRRWRV